MSAPALPDIFGNYALGDFVEVVSPESVSWWPQTVGWAWLGAAVLVLLLRRGWVMLRRWYRNRYRREAEARLQALAARGEEGCWLTELNRLLKITAIAGFSRERVASLSGRGWVDFLNRQCDSPPFPPEVATLLAVGTYTRETPDAAQRARLLAASRAWVREHRNPLDD